LNLKVTVIRMMIVFVNEIVPTAAKLVEDR